MNKLIHREHIEIAGDGKNVVNVVFVQDVVNQLIRLATTQARTYEMIEVVGDNIEVIDLIYKVNEMIYEKNPDTIPLAQYNNAKYMDMVMEAKKYGNTERTEGYSIKGYDY